TSVLQQSPQWLIYVNLMKNHEKYALQHKKTLYICTVFFMVLDLRLTKDWVVVRQPFLLFIPLNN
ncbi:MAG: hypothetical protein LWW91_01000, partial [Bacteroidales bacterium]|nr:hypothetical protein [Bacteroidales bacterium]